MITIDFEADHAKELYDGMINDDRNRPAIMISQFVDEVVVKNLSFTAVNNGKIICSGGIYPIWHGVGDAWFVGSNTIYDYPITITKLVKKTLNELMDINNFHRVQAYVRHDWEDAQRWIKVLGMQNEGTVRKYSTDGRDHILFSKVT